MKVLMLTPYLPYPPSSGGQVRSYNLIKYLAKKHEITLFSLVKNQKDTRYINQLEKFCRRVKTFSRPAQPWTLGNILRTGFSCYPFLVIRNLSKEQRSAVKLELEREKYDLVHAETFYVMPHLSKATVPTVLVDQTIEYQVYQHYMERSAKWFLKPLMYLDVLKIKYWETRFWRQADRVVAVSEEDKKKMVSLVPNLKVEIVPNGAGEDLMAVWDNRQPLRQPIVFFQANFNWLQNVEAAEVLVRQVFPEVVKQLPKAECWVVGQAAREKIGFLARPQVVIKDLDQADITGVVEAYRRADIFVAPLYGPGGTRLKILAAMAAGVPVVTTKVGIEGIEAMNNQEVLVASEPAGLAKLAVEVFTDKVLYQRLINQARKLVEGKYSYQSVAQKLDKIYQEVAGG